MPLEATFAVPLAGGVLCALNIRLAADEIRYILGHCGASLLLFDAELDPLIAQLEPAIPTIRFAGTAAPTEPAEREYETLLGAADPAALVRRTSGEDATISINYTSGTTGRPKGVMYTYRGAYLSAFSESFHAGLRPAQRIVDVTDVPL